LKDTKFQEPNISININIDGIPLYQDSRSFYAYPILLQLCIPNASKLICLGVYLSESGNENKIPAINNFLEDFVEDMSHMLREGLTIGVKHFAVGIQAFVCDAPARSELKRIVNHNSY